MNSSMKMSVHVSGAMNKENKMVGIFKERLKTIAKTSLFHFIKPWCSRSLNTACFS